MSTLGSIIKNTAARTGTEITNRLASGVFWVLIARYLGASGLGMLVFGITLFAFFNTLSSLGLGAVVTRDIAQHRDKGPIYFGTSIMLGSMATLFFIGIMMLVGRFFSPDRETMRVVMVLSVALLPVSLFYWSKAVLCAVEKMEFIAYSRIAENAFKIIVGTIFLLAGQGIEAIAVVFVLSKITSTIMCFGFARREVGKPIFTICKPILRSLLRQVPTFASTSLFNSLFWSSTVILLTYFRGAAEVGIFSAAFKLVDMCLAVALAYGQALFPVTARIAVQIPELLVQLCRKSIKHISILTLAVAVGTTVLSDPIILLIYGSGLAEASQALRLQIWMLVPFGAVPLLAFILISKHYQKCDMQANVIAALLLTGLNFILIPTYGMMGASIAMLIGCTVLFISEYLFVSVKLFRFHFRVSNLKWVVSAGFIALVTVFLENINELLVVLICGIFYLILLYITGIISQSDLEYYKRLRSV
jgi:O-antigen/teichoic acid export membrane protein